MFLVCVQVLELLDALNAANQVNSVADIGPAADVNTLVEAQGA